MRKECNPSGKQGDRNLFCRDYDYCLDTAIARSWDSWNCTKCRFRFTSPGERQKLTISTEDIIEYGLMIHSPDLEWGLPDYDFNGDHEVATVY